jgi:transposase
MDELVTMSGKEITRLEAMKRIEDKRLTQKEASRMLNLSERQVKRLYRAYKEQGAKGLISKRRGQPSNHQMDSQVKQRVLDLLKERYEDFGPTLAHEKLTEVHGVKISRESVRQMMMAEKMWKPKGAKEPPARQMRERRACIGELVQVDGSPHDWFEGRAPKCTLLVFIDDATGRLGELRFVESESFFSYCQAAEAYIRRQGKPGALYSDRHGVFRVNQPSVGHSDALTQFGRAMQELGIQIICAHSPEAKGRVERAIQTLQDRLPKEMRLRGVSDWDEGNAYLPEFMDDFNRRFAVQPRSTHDAHLPLTAQDNLAHILTWQETRILSKNLTLQFNKVVYQIQSERPDYALRHTRVTVCKDAAGHVTILHRNRPLAFTIFHPQAKQSEVVHTKQIDQALDRSRSSHKPAPDHPWRKGFATPLSQSASLSGDRS